MEDHICNFNANPGLFSQIREESKNSPYKYFTIMIIGSNLLFHESLSSTNTTAAQLVRTGEPAEGTIIHTDFQSAGRGQAGNKWESEKGKNLLFSIILYPKSVRPEDQFLISMTISLGICDFLDRHCQGTRIKWPNDIYFNNDKIAGILIENSIMGSSIENTIAGIGLNINQEKFTGVHPDPVSLKMATGKDYDTADCLTDLLSDLDKRYKQLLYGDRGMIRNDYLSRLYRFNEWRSYKLADSVFSGRIKDVLMTGQIRIEQEDGSIRDYSFKEFGYLP
jgi:BirA family transcriptional regulator, biotin operon repressor / biotin---[acetyl-CoA-carboxylase] ligase